MLLFQIYRALSMLLSLLSWALLIYCLLTWIAPRSAACAWLGRFISPLCAPFRGLSMKIRARWGSPFDFTCLFAMIALQIADSLLRAVVRLILF